MGIWVTLCGISVQSPAAQTSAAEVCIRSSTMTPLAEPVRIPAAVATAVLASFLVQTTARSHGMSPSEVCTARTVHRHDLAVGIEPGDPRLVVDIDAGVVVGLFGRHEQAFEVRYLPAMDVRNAARAVADVLELGVDPDIRRWVGALGRPGRADARGAATDHHDPLRHR